MTEWNDTKLRWTDADIADVEQTAKAAEQARIIKLLEDSDIGRCCFESHDLIARIKGDNK